MKKCDLGLISHKDIAEKFKETFLRCPLFAHKESGMSVLGVLCCNCCLRTQQVLDKRAELLRGGFVLLEDIERDPNCFVEQLTGTLREYGEVVPKVSNSNWSEIQVECSRCRAGINESIYRPENEATRITHVGRNDLR